MTWGGLGQLSKLHGLQHLNCAGIKWKHAAASQLPEVLARLTSLHIGDAVKLHYAQDSHLAQIGQHAKNLRALDASGCIDVSDAGEQWI
jgi:hypothetical protein